MLRKLSAAFTGGVIGALLSSLLFWELGRNGVTAWMGITLRPACPLHGFIPAWSQAACGDCCSCCRCCPAARPPAACYGVSPLRPLRCCM